MKRGILALLATLAIVALVVPAAVFAAEEGTITCTVTATIVSVSVEDGYVDYGTIPLGEIQNTIELGETQTVTNDGTVEEDFFIKSSNATREGGTTWELVGLGADVWDSEFRHEFSTDGGTSWTPMQWSYDDTGDHLDPGGWVNLDLQITMPPSTDDYLEHEITVTVLAVESAP